MATIIEMVNHTRLDCVIGAAAGMRQALAQATHHCTHRRAFGRHLVDQPLMTAVLADMAVEAEAATLTMVRLAAAYDRAADDPGDAQFRRLATAVAKYWLCKRHPVLAGEALECLGGNGYVEESILPRLFRESPLNGIWEGSGNVICLDVLRAMARQPESVEAFFAELAGAAGADPRLDAAVADLRQQLDRSEEVEARARFLGGENGAGPAGSAPGAPRSSRGGRRLLRLPPRGRLGPRLRNPAVGARPAGHRGAGHAQVGLGARPSAGSVRRVSSGELRCQLLRFLVGHGPGTTAQ